MPYFSGAKVMKGPRWHKMIALEIIEDVYNIRQIFGPLVI